MKICIEWKLNCDGWHIYVLLLSESAPYFVEHLEDYYSKGPDVILRASAEGDPAASYVWYRNGMEITDNDTTPGTRFSSFYLVIFLQRFDLFIC